MVYYLVLWTILLYPHQILDIGTGTGLVAIMLAQRFTRSQIHAIDIDQASAEEAQFNAQSRLGQND